MFSDDIEVAAALYEDYLEELENMKAKLEEKLL